MDAPTQVERSPLRTVGVWLGVLVASGALLGGAWWARSGGTETPAVASGTSLRPTAVELARVRQGTFEVRRQYTGTLEAAASFVAAPRVGGRIRSIDVDLGDTVAREQVIGRIDDTTLRRELSVAKAELGVVAARRLAAVNALEIARRNFDRVEALTERGITSTQELDTLRAEKLDAEGDVAVAKAEAARAGAQVQAAAARVEEARIVAQWEGGSNVGVVSVRHVDPGETVSPNAPVVTVVDVSEVVVVVYATQGDLVRLRKGQRVRVQTDSLPDAVFEGQVDRVAPVLSAGSRQARVEMRIPNPQAKLTPGMFVRVSTVLDALPDALSVPADAVVERAGRQVVFAVEGGVARARPVKILGRAEDQVAVEAAGGEGLGEAVVLLGIETLEDGDAVRVIEGAPAGAS